MAMSERLAFLLDFRADNAIRSMEQVGRTADKQLGKAEDKASRLGATMTRAGAGMLAAGGVMAAGLMSAGRSASDLNESINVTGLTFGSAADDIEAFADTAATDLGMSKRAALDAASGFGGLLQNMGVTRGESVKLSKDLTSLASDMASAFNTDTQDAVLALGSALRGESEPIRRFNVFLDDAAVKARAVEMGLAASAGEVDNSAKVQARLNIIMEQTSRIQGDFANTADGAANAQRVLAAQTENFKAALGDAAMPVMQDGLGILNGLLGAFNAMPPAVKGAVSQAAVLTSGFLLMGGAASTVIGKASTMVSTFQKLREKAKGNETWIETLRGVGGGAAKAGAAFGLTAVAVGLYAEMMGKATQAGQDFAAQVEQDSFTSIASWDELQSKIEATRQGADDLRSSQSGGLLGLTIDSDYNRELQAGAAGLEQIATKYDLVAQRADELASATGISNDSAVQFISTQAALGVEFDTTEAAVEEWRKTVDGGTEAVNAQISSVDELKKGIRDYFDELHATKDAQIAFESAIDDTIEGLKESGINYDLSGEAGRRNTENVQALQSSLGDLYADQIRQGKSSDEARLAVLRHAESLRQQAIDAGLSTAATDDLIGKLDLASTYDHIETEFQMAGVNQATTQVQGLKADIDSIPWYKRVLIEMEATKTGGGWSELTALKNRDATVSAPTSAGRSAGMLPTGGGTSIVLNVTAGLGTDGQQVGEQIATALKQYVQSGGVVTVA